MDKLLTISIYLRKVDAESGTFFTNIRVWNLETNTKIFDKDIRDLENFSVGNFNNPYLVALFCKTPELLDFKNQAQVLRYGVIPEGGYGDYYIYFLFDKFLFSPILIMKVIDFIFLIFSQFSWLFLLWNSVIHPHKKRQEDFEMEAFSLTLNISSRSWSNLATKDSFEISSS